MRLDSEMVELCGIEPQSKTELPKASTCLEKLFVSRFASHNLQGYTKPVSRFVCDSRHATNIATWGLYLSTSI